MEFATVYKNEITLVFYCFTVVLTIAIFIVGTLHSLYLRNIDRREEQRREWRQVVENINSDNSKLKAAGIPQKISNVKKTFEKLRIAWEVTGLDVLRYMLDDANFERFKTTQLECLRKDLQSIFQLLNVCSSMLLLGELPKDIKEELTDPVTDLGEITFPLFKGERRKIILKCLEHFGRNGPPQPATEKEVSKRDATLAKTVPYVKILRFGSPDDDGLVTDIHRRGFQLGGESDYSKCTDFLLTDERKRADLTFLPAFLDVLDLHEALKDRRHMAIFATKWRERQPTLPAPFLKLKNLIEQVNRSNDTDEDVLVKFLHDVRVYIHLLLDEDYREQIKVTTTTRGDVSCVLGKVWEEVKDFIWTKDTVDDTCKRCISALQRFQKNLHTNGNYQQLGNELVQIKESLCRDIQIMKKKGLFTLPTTNEVDRTNLVPSVNPPPPPCSLGAVEDRPLERGGDEARL